MRTLLIDPEDEPRDGAWVRSHWDRVVDLGRSGQESYAQASAAFGCKVTQLDALRSEFEEVRRMRDLLASGFGRLTDGLGLDWWELISIMVHQELETIVLLSKLAMTIERHDDIHVSRPGFHARALQEMFGGRVRVFRPQAGREKGSVRHYARLLNKFPMRQLVEIFWDKADPGYRLRGRFARLPEPLPEGVVLLPSAYINVTRTALAYAKSVPRTTFLLVATRRSGWVQALPDNVAARWLKSYSVASDSNRKAELDDLLGRWETFRKEIEQQKEFRILSVTGRLDDFPRRFVTGLHIRDAWRKVLDREHVKAVLCADDSNPNTRMPLLLAKKRGIPTVACHHGALDGRYMFKRAHADVVLAKGKMEEDYLVRVCGLPKGVVEIGAPATNACDAKRNVQLSSRAGRSIVFFSETYEVSGGRGRDFYGDILPRLAYLALKENRELVIKLHPFESLVERKEFATSVLNSQQARAVRWVTGPLQRDLLDTAWFAVTVLSTAAVECAFRGVPCFLCKWLDFSAYGYVDQFIRYGIGIGLASREDLERIPPLLAEHKQSPTLGEDCGRTVRKERLEELLGMHVSQPVGGAI